MRERTLPNFASVAQQETGLFQKMSDADVVSYWDRWRTFGYEATMRWAISKYGQQSTANR
jgi:hypothetical protein